ncbi:hypothetical protein COCSUDRAFT_63341 [Coccomyxa subellipsoidea C-169]|uniref:Uncharacterized protein n=1 Tax=Coccomyxa subellipsoidea (strain C-169) TaxID=574566 RepID=I0YX25_COCSC|nr:hypothetical protein COCSUDRAFT_63341 [Coccomyxa subellipsoidea C-169]EIE22944.1 hypothetical protein COCSUDRAFT_63341 [Coccomyxa subellipsoidea C-169]|eukprot:XP_005647488.1 hypothetical protein COCSUDRAFT_63341 [Coccomyxa subellipsoidea C-169]
MAMEGTTGSAEDVFAEKQDTLDALINGSNSSLGSLVSSLRSLLSSTSSTGWLATAGLLSDTSLPMPDTEQPPIVAPHTTVQTLQGWPSGLQIPGDGDFQEAPEEPQEMPNEPLAVESRRSPSRRGAKRPLPEDGGRPTVAGTEPFYGFIKAT